MLDILLQNYLLWINILIPFVIGIYLYFTHKEYSLKEFGIQVSLTTFILVLAFYISYNAQDITTKSYSTTKVDKFVYEEPWTELVHYTVSYKCGKSTCYSHRTRNDYHPAEYYLQSSFGTFYIGEKGWNDAKNKFYMRQIDSRHTSQISYGDGRTYESIPAEIVPVSSYTEDLNYIYASKTNIIKSAGFKDLEKRYKDELVKYPEISKDNSQFNTPNFPRVFNAHLVSEQEAKFLQKELEEFSATNSVKLSVNPIIYFTSATSRDIVHVIKGFYKDAHPNDAILVVSITGNKINWTQSVSLTKSAEFIVESTSFQDVTLQNLTEKFKNNILKNWKPVRMEDYKYLSGDIDLPWGFEIFIVFLNIVGSFFVFRYMLHNEI